MYITMKTKNKQKREWKRSGVFNEHHIQNKCRGGQSIQSNLLRLDTRRHDAFHLLFGNLDLDEVIEVLVRVRDIKKSQAKVFKLT